MEDNELNDSEQTTDELKENSLEETAESAKNEENNSISSDLIRGHINTIILRALYERDKYGYEIMNDIEVKSHGQYSLKQPTLYSALKRLENQGYIRAYWKTDEVSSGGRRKYFTLTESGKDITEKNLAEWEYSRTIIDSLISDRSFDFSNPAPTPVDFHILKNSVSRVPIVRSDESGRSEQEGVSAESTEQTAQVTQPSQDVVTNGTQNSEAVVNYTETILQQNDAYTLQSYEIRPAQAEQPIEQPIAQQNADIQSTNVQEQEVAAPTEQPVTPQISQQEEARRIAHENYLRLISEPVRAETRPPKDDIVPNSENVNAEDLLYNNRPETERDYKNLIDGIFSRAVSNGRVQTAPKRVEPQPAPPPEPPRRIRLVDRGRADGVAVSTSNSFDSESTYATKTTYNKGSTFLKCAAIVLAIIVIESVFCFIFQSQLGVDWVYPTVLLILGLIQFSVFGIMAVKGYGKNCVRPTTNSYISSCIILTVISILIISALSFILNINFTSASDVMKMIVIPSITALNITVFAVCFKLFVK